LNCPPQGGIKVVIKDSGSGFEFSTANADLNQRILFDVLDPSGLMMMFGEKVEVTLVGNEPDLNRPG